MGACSSKKVAGQNKDAHSTTPNAVSVGTGDKHEEKIWASDTAQILTAVDAVEDEAKHHFYAETSYQIVKDMQERIIKDMQASKSELADLSKESTQLPKFNANDLNPPYIPSPYSLRYLVPPPATIGFQRYNWEQTYSGRGKILVVATSAYELKLRDDKAFYTGHHTTEIFVPMIHLADAGFEFVIATIDGKPVCLEDWTFPIAEGYEADLRAMQKKIDNQLKRPVKTSEVDITRDNIVAVFMPGGHGAMIQSGNDPAVGQLLRAAHANEILTASICHGVHTLVAARLGDSGEFPYKGYEAVCFPDYIDEPVAQQGGYLPAKMLNLPQHELRENGVKVKNTESANMPMDQVWLDRELLTGLSQASAQMFGKQFTEILMEKHMPGSKSKRIFEADVELAPEKATSGVRMDNAHEEILLAHGEVAAATDVAAADLVELPSPAQKSCGWQFCCP